MSTNPNQAILFHRTSIESSIQSMSHNFATLHNIKVDEGNRPVIMEGQLMSHDCMVSVLKGMLEMKQKKSLRILPENVIAQSDDSLVWYVPCKARTMLFKRGSQMVKMFVPYPTLIFKVIDNTLSVVASKYKRKPKADDSIFHAPLMNIYVDSRVCVGTANCPANADIDSVAGWQSVIFDTLFTHTNHSSTLRQKQNKQTSNKRLFSFWRSIKGDKQFPNNRLNKLHNLTLEEWVEQ